LRVVVDTNVVLDVLLVRKPFSDWSARVFALVERSALEGFLCATTVTTVDYLLSRCMAREDAKQALRRLLSLFEIAPVNRPVLDLALSSSMADFEDAVLAHSGMLVDADAVVTRNTQDFSMSPIPALSPDEVVAQFRERHP